PSAYFDSVLSICVLSVSTSPSRTGLRLSIRRIWSTMPLVRRLLGSILYVLTFPCFCCTFTVFLACLGAFVVTAGVEFMAFSTSFVVLDVVWYRSPAVPVKGLDVDRAAGTSLLRLAGPAGRR